MLDMDTDTAQRLLDTTTRLNRATGELIHAASMKNRYPLSNKSARYYSEKLEAYREALGDHRRIVDSLEVMK